MGFKCGIVGLPNVGKSTLFNALTQTISAESANYPFCTIEPNVGVVSVPDNRLGKLAEISGSKEIIPTKLKFVDIAGLVKGASKGEGLGNQFLSNIREVDAIIHVVRCFENSDITHVEETIDPIRDIDIIETELMLSDLENIEKRIENTKKKAKNGEKDAKALMSVMEKVLPLLQDGKPARLLEIDESNTDEIWAFKVLQLLSAKPVLYVCNVDEESAANGNDLSKKVFEFASKEGNNAVIISASIEEEIANLDDDNEKIEFLETIGLHETGLARVIKSGYELLGLLTFFTTGPKETHAWTVAGSSKAPQAAGVIHTDFEKGFIRAETISYNDFIEFNGEGGAKENGKFRIEGKEYTVQDGDIFNFLFNN